jgi:hypothetical protein
MCVIRRHGMRKLSISDKEELYDVIAALSATIRELTKEIVELHGIQEINSRAIDNLAYYLREGPV